MSEETNLEEEEKLMVEEKEEVAVEEEEEEEEDKEKDDSSILISKFSEEDDEEEDTEGDEMKQKKEQQLTFSSHVMVNVEEFIYFSVKLGIQFQLQNNHILVGPAYENDSPPQAVMNMMNAIRLEATEDDMRQARNTLEVFEEIEKQQEWASMLSLSRDDLYTARRQCFPDDKYFCKGLLSFYAKNTMLTYPPESSLEKKSKRMMQVQREENKKAFSVVLSGGVVVSRARDGSFNHDSIQHLTTNDIGGIQDSPENEKRRSRPHIKGNKPIKQTADSFHINKRKLNNNKSNPLETGEDSAEPELEARKDHEENNDQIGYHEASWADEQNPDVQTYYISASMANSTPAPSTESSFSSKMPEATATPLPLGVDPRSPSLSSRSPAAYQHTSNVTVEVVPDNVPYDRPPSLSVQQEFMLRNGSIRSPDSKSKAPPAKVHGIDLTSEIAAESTTEQCLGVEEESKCLPCKIAVQSKDHFGENVKKVWKAELPFELTSADLHGIRHEEFAKPRKPENVSEFQCLLNKIVLLLCQKYSFPSPYKESVTGTLNELDIHVNSDEESEYCLTEGDVECKMTDPHQQYRFQTVAKDVIVNKMLLMYFDSDVEDFVALDAESLEDFLNHSKKALRVDYVPVKANILRQVPATGEENQSTAGSITTVDKDMNETDDNANASNTSINTKSAEEKGTSGVVTVTSVGILNDSSDVVMPVSDGSSCTPDDDLAQRTPYGHWKWTTRKKIDSDFMTPSELDADLERCLADYYVGPKTWSALVAINGVRTKDLEKSLVFALLKQRQRPFVLEFESRHGAGVASNHSNAHPLAPSGHADHSKQDGRLPASTFLAKYSHPAAKSLRKQVDKLLKNFDEYDWAAPKSSGEAGGNSPQAFVTSLYRSIENELENLGLFDSSTPQGGGVPEMLESHWADVRMHIETLVFNSIYEHIRDMAPSPEVYELYSRPVDGAPDQRSMVPLATKCAFLSFLSLRDMGMDLPEELVSPCKYSLACTDTCCRGSFGNPSSLPEEWRLGLKELCRATEMRSPLKIMQRFRHAVMMLTHAVESMIGRPLKYTESDAVEQAKREAENVNAKQVQNKVSEEGKKKILKREYIRPAGYYTPVTLGADELMPVLSWAIIQANPPAIDMAVWLCGEFRHPNNHMGEAAYTLTQVSSALEFVKAATWRDFDVEESYFRRGLQRYEATQDLIQACKRGNVSNGSNVETIVDEFLDKGADINGLSVDKSDSALSAAIKTRNIELTKVLLKKEGIDINLRICPYFPGSSANATAPQRPKASKGPKHHSESSSDKSTSGKETGKKKVMQDCTALMIAAFTGQVAAVALLLDHGADRYLVNEAGDTAASLAFSAGHQEAVRVLLSDENQCSLIEAVTREDILSVRGMLLQHSVRVDGIGAIARYRKRGEDGRLSQTVDIFATALHAAAYFRDVDMANVLLHSRRVDANKCNSCGETALMWCGASNSLVDRPVLFDGRGEMVALQSQPEAQERNEADEDICRAQIACALLKEGANRSLRDDAGRTAYHWAKFGNEIDEPNQHYVTGVEEVPIEELPYISAECRYPRLAAVIYYDPSRFKIYHLARDGCIAGVRALLDQGVSINDSCPEGWYTPLIAAVYNKDVTMVRFLLQFSSIEVNFKGKQQTTALHYAAQEGCLAICGLLLFHNADRSALTSTGLLPIDFALSKGHKEIAACLRFDPQKVSICLASKHGDMNVFAALLNQGVSINAKLRHVSEKGTHHELTTPLISAVAFGQLEFIRQVIANKDTLLANAFHYTSIMKPSRPSGEDIDIDETNFVGQTALMYAAAGGDEDMLLYLLKLGADRYARDKEGRSAAKWAKNNNHPQLYMILVCDPAKSSVHHAIRDGNMDATIAFFKQDPNPNVRYFSSLAAPTRSSETAPPHPVSLNAADHPRQAEESILDGESPLVVAAKYGRLAIVRLLFRAPEIEIDNVDTFGKTALMHASERGHEDVVLLLLKHKANRGAMCYSQKRAIDYAAANNFVDIVDILDADPYKVHIQDAAEKGNARHVNALLKQGCPPNYQDERPGKRNRTALMCAASKGRLNVVKLLLSLSTTQSINLDIQDADGMTALMHAARIGNLEVTGALLTANCSRDIVDVKGRTAQSHASSHGFLTGTQFKAQLMWR